MSPVKSPKLPRKKADLSCSCVKFCLCVSGGFWGGLLPFLPVVRQKRRQLVLAVRTIITLW
ncbi:plasmid mobilization protein [Erwinia billingiae]|nr:plasmid mobilization protein [Erwinia billingiae]